jgi:phosphate transport system permease protein
MKLDREARSQLRRDARRKLLSYVVTILGGLSVLVVMIPLASVIYTAAVRGGSLLLNPALYTSLPPLPGCTSISCQSVGIGPAIQGTLLLLGLSGAISTAIGVAAAIFASEYRTYGLGRAISFTADVLTGVPSIIMGVFIYSYFALYDPALAFSAWTGTLALSVLMIPIVIRTTEEALRTVPNALREAALALGMPKWKATLRVVLVTALPGIVTGVLLSLMRAAGEAAPLLFTAFGSRNFFTGMNQPVAALPLLIFSFAESSFGNWIRLAWAATLLLILLVLAANVLSRLSLQRMVRRMGGR